MTMQESSREPGGRGKECAWLSQGVTLSKVKFPTSFCITLTMRSLALGAALVQNADAEA